MTRSASSSRLLQGYRPVLSTEVKDGKEVTKVGDYQWFTYGEVQVKIDAFGSGMVHLGLAKDDGLGVRIRVMRRLVDYLVVYVWSEIRSVHDL